MPGRDTAALPLRPEYECDGTMSSPTTARTPFWRRPFALDVLQRYLVFPLSEVLL